MNRKWTLIVACIGAIGLLLGSGTPAMAWGSHSMNSEGFIENVNKTAPGTNYNGVIAVRLDSRPDSILEPLLIDSLGAPMDLCGGTLTHVSFVIRIDKSSELRIFTGLIDENLLDCGSLPEKSYIQDACYARVKLGDPDNYENIDECALETDPLTQQECYDRVTLAETPAVPLCSVEDKDLIEIAVMNYLQSVVAPALGGDVEVVAVSKSVVEGDNAPFYAVFNFKIAVK